MPYFHHHHRDIEEIVVVAFVVVGNWDIVAAVVGALPIDDARNC